MRARVPPPATRVLGPQSRARRNREVLAVLAARASGDKRGGDRRSYEQPHRRRSVRQPSPRRAGLRAPRVGRRHERGPAVRSHRPMARLGSRLWKPREIACRPRRGDRDVDEEGLESRSRQETNPWKSLLQKASAECDASSGQTGTPVGWRALTRRATSAPTEVADRADARLRRPRMSRAARRPGEWSRQIIRERGKRGHRRLLSRPGSTAAGVN